MAEVSRVLHQNLLSSGLRNKRLLTTMLQGQDSDAKLQHIGILQVLSTVGPPTAYEDPTETRTYRDNHC
ncbi:unnamed protein product [Gongylonema pulchrum]|uniref:ARM repeat superfamily protein n=1 Tax=Gongylonema pulchrum TaxID=637853 RepID=A0A183E169_9BILA|nr:unnamed protein product [Gongylonema pulchrum]